MKAIRVVVMTEPAIAFLLLGSCKAYTVVLYSSKYMYFNFVHSNQYEYTEPLRT